MSGSSVVGSSTFAFHQALRLQSASSFEAEASGLRNASDENRTQGFGQFDDGVLMLLDAVERWRKTGLAEDAQYASMVARLNCKMRQDVADELSNTINAMNAAAGNDGIPNMDRELIDGQKEVIDKANEELKAYQKIVEMYTDFYERLTKAMSAIAGYAKADPNDANYVKIEKDKMLKELDDLLEYAKGLSADLPGPKPMSDELAKQWQDKLGPSVKVDKQTGKVTIKTDQVEAMKKSVEALDNRVNNATYQAWQSAMKANESNVQNAASWLLQRFQTAQGIFDNLVKVLSNTMVSLRDAEKQYLQF